MGFCAVAQTCGAQEDPRWQEKSDGMFPRASYGRPALSPNHNPCRFARQRLCYGISDTSLDGEALPPDRFTNDRFFKSPIDHYVLIGQCSGAERTQRSGAACRVRRSGVRWPAGPSARLPGQTTPPGYGRRGRGWRPNTLWEDQRLAGR